MGSDTIKPSPAEDAKESTENDPLVPKKEARLGGLFCCLDPLVEAFGYKLLLCLFFTQHLLKGFANVLVQRATPYMYKLYGVPAPQAQIFGGVTQLPWALKPIIGLVSDLVPILGFNKAPYMGIVSVLGGIALASAAFLPQNVLTVGLFVVCLFMAALQQSTCDLLSEAKYAEKMQTAPQHGPSLLSYVWFGLTLGGLFATLISGPVLDKFGPTSMFAVALVPALFVLYPVCAGYMEEKKITPEQVAEMRERYLQQKEACVLCLLMLLGTAAIITCSLISRDPLYNSIVAICVAIMMLVSFSVVLSPLIARANAFALIQTALGLSTGGASFYFYTDTPKQYPEGPHFSEFFYNTVMGVVGSLISLLGIYLYQRYMSSWKYRDLLLATNFALAFFSALDIMMFARLNVKFGIPDHVLVLGLSVFESLIAQWQWMPQVVILSYLCPKGMEATMYALLAGCHNMGNTIAANCGALLLDRLGCRPSGADGESAQFENLWKAATVSTVLPFVAVILLIRLMPDARQNERLVGDDIGDATAGSLWRRWRGT
eukprot:TRINITY_DN13577_c1_g7_i1.p1 TRINITY_DN13577_c1_g7~~TRINITY_DN13577_c1_g7_i1.p1  ORF type:complete len:545 (-),score=115.44 TRINITY_DN13577_c1_g7_i1:257-1891(-)